MPNTQVVFNLDWRARELRRNLLPAKFDVRGIYGNQYHDMAAAYAVLMHAEIEECLEAIALNAVRLCVNQGRGHSVGQSTAALMAYGPLMYAEGATIESYKKVIMLSVGSLRYKHLSSLQDLQRQFTKTVRSNQGIREANIYRLFLPVGLPFPYLNNLSFRGTVAGNWLQKIDEFGQQRGKVAHQANTVYQPLDPKYQYEMVQLILRGIRVIDRKLLNVSYRRIAR